VLDRLSRRANVLIIPAVEEFLVVADGDEQAIRQVASHCGVGVEVREVREMAPLYTMEPKPEPMDDVEIPEHVLDDLVDEDLPDPVIDEDDDL
jgi:hypothetical protein